MHSRCARCVFLFLLVILPAFPAAAADGGWLCFLVRHAEKAQGSGDVELSEAGRARAETLAAMLSPAGVTHVWTSDQKRARQTAAPLTARTGVSAHALPAGDVQAFAEAVRTMGPGDVGVVVGHSNTVPEILRALGCPSAPRLEESDYDRLFIVVGDHDGTVKMTELRYAVAR